MNRQDTTLLAALAAVAVLLPVILGLSLGWPSWFWGLLVVVLLTITALASRQLQHRREQESLRQLYEQQGAMRTEQPPPAPPSPERYKIAEVPLTSADADYRFIFSATVYWQSASNATHAPRAHLESLAANAILGRASDVTSTRPPDDYALTQHTLAATLSTAAPNHSGQVLAWADNISLTISNEDAEQLRALSGLRKRQRMWEHERDVEDTIRTYLGEDALRSTGSAVVWWLARHTDQVKETVQLIGTLAQLSAAANDTEVPELFLHLLPEGMRPQLQQQPLPLSFTNLTMAAESPFSLRHNGGQEINPKPTIADHANALADEIFANPDDGQRALFGHELATLVDEHGGHDLAERIRGRFKAPDFDIPDSTTLAQSEPPEQPAPPNDADDLT